MVYAGPARVPTPIFNEKVLAGLGSGVDRSGPLPAEPRHVALAALNRFRLLLAQMKVKRTRVVATAAIRDAADGAQFVREIHGSYSGVVGLPLYETCALLKQFAIDPLSG